MNFLNILWLEAEWLQGANYGRCAQPQILASVRWSWKWYYLILVQLLLSKLQISHRLKELELWCSHILIWLEESTCGSLSKSKSFCNSSCTFPLFFSRLLVPTLSIFPLHGSPKLWNFWHSLKHPCSEMKRFTWQCFEWYEYHDARYLMV